MSLECTQIPKKGIIVSGAECSVIGSALSVVVIDEVAIQARSKEKEEENGAKKGLLRLDGLVVPSGEDGLLLYLGQVEAKPSWTHCAT